MSTMMYGKIQKMTFALMTALALLVCQCSGVSASELMTVQVRSAPLQSGTITKDGMVRVYLSSLGNPTSLDLTVQGNYSLSHSGEFIANGSRIRVDFSTSTGNLTLTYGGQTYHMGRSFSLRRHSASGSNGILIAQSRESHNPYPGDLSFEAVYSGGSYTLYTVAHIYIENYLYGVLPYEMGDSSGMEALKAQAVAARTYTVRMMEKRASGLYDVKDTTSDQVYRGTPSGNANCVAAVDATKGIVLMYGSDYITTYYSASNGGQTETSRTGSSYAYMKVKDDPFDYANPSSTVKKKTIYEDLTNSSNPTALTALLKNKAIATLQRSGYPASADNTTLKKLKNVTPHSPMYPSPSRVYTQMDFTFTVSTQNASGQAALVTLTESCGIFTELESLLGMGIQSMQNELWSVEKGSGSFVLQARRYGHGMGMSQRGAMYMAGMGYTYDQILGFYYEGCRRVKHSFTNKILSASSSDQQITVETPAELENQGDGKWSGTVTLAGNHSSLAIRSSTDHNSKVIGIAGNGALVEILCHDGNWYQIRFGELVGFVPAESLTVKGTQGQEQQEDVTNILGFAVVTANDYVNLRASGSMSAKVLGTAPSNAVLTVFSWNGSWAKVQYQALSAYVNTGFISAITENYPSSGLSTGSRKATVITENGTGTVKLRQTASANAQLLTSLPAGTVVTVLSDDGSWCRVSCESGEGYILAQYLRYEENGQSPSGENNKQHDESIPDVDEDEENTAQAELSAIVSTISGSLNLRSEASAGSRILTTLPKGTAVTVLATGNEWTAVRYNGYDGYVMTCYLAFRSNQPDQNETKPETSLLARYAHVNTQSGSLNLRDQPSLNSSVLTAIPQFAKVDVTAYGTGWCSVRYKGYEGYVLTRYLCFEQENDPQLEIKPSQPVEEIKMMWVNTVSGSLNLRSEPDGRSQILTTIPQHAQVTLSAKGTEWSAIAYGGYTGYVMTKFLSAKKPSDSGSGAPPSNEAEIPEQEEHVEPFVTHGGIVLDVTLDVPPSAAFATALTDARIYNMCSEDGSYLFTVSAGETVEIVLEGKYWCRIAYQNQQGYCLTNALSER